MWYVIITKINFKYKLVLLHKYITKKHLRPTFQNNYKTTLLAINMKKRTKLSSTWCISLMSRIKMQAVLFLFVRQETDSNVTWKTNNTKKILFAEKNMVKGNISERFCYLWKFQSKQYALCQQVNKYIIHCAIKPGQILRSFLQNNQLKKKAWLSNTVNNNFQFISHRIS